jgi:hypothetical protein
MTYKVTRVKKATKIIKDTKGYIPIPVMLSK